MTNLEFILSKATSEDMTQWFLYLFGDPIILSDSEIYTCFNEEINAAIWGYMETCSDYCCVGKARFVNTFLSLKYDKKEWHKWVKNYYKFYKE